MLQVLALLSALTTAQPPHLLVILVDDLGYNNVGWHNPDMKTPEIDALATEEGVVLEALYTFRYCSPTRSSLMTGRFPIHVNQGNPRCVGTRGGVDLRMAMLPAKLKRAGYETAIIGKWHLGARSARNLPTRRGFDYHFGFLGGGEHHLTQRSYECENYVDLWEATGGADGGPAYGQNGTDSCELYGAKAVSRIIAHDPTTPLFMCQ